MKKLIRHAVIAVVASLFAGGVAYYDLLYHLDNMAADALYQAPQSLGGEIMVVGIDVNALTEYGPFNTWNRDIIADVIDSLNSDPDMRPAAIGIDVMFFGNSNPENDQKLVEAAARYDNVVLASSVNFKSTVVKEGDSGFYLNNYAVDSIDQPFDDLKAVTKQGLINVIPDADGVVRRSLHCLDLEDGSRINSFGYEIYKKYAEKHGLPSEIQPPSNSLNQWYIPFHGLPEGYNDGFSVVDAIEGNIPPELFEDAVVLIGPYATGMMDSYITSIDRTIPMYGVELHANIIDALINQDFMVHVSGGVQFFATAFILMVGYFCFKNIKPRFTPLVLIVLAGGYVLCAYLLGTAGYLLKVIYVPIALVIMFISWLIINYTRELWEKKKITDNFKKYVAPDLVDQLIRSGETLSIGGQRRDIACMFVDIRGFTRMAENLEPEQTVDILNRYLGLTCNAIFAHNGTLDKFIGDAAMAIYNAPFDLDDYIYRSILTAWDIIQGSDELGDEVERIYGKRVRCGIGIACGSAVVGNIGNQVRMDFTAIGDTVNTASRLESLAKPGQVLMSEAVYNAVKDRITADYLGEVPIKGKTQNQHIYSLTGINDLPGTPALPQE